MNAQILNWDDIPFVLAVCEAGSLSEAARNLGVNHSTVYRRIDGVESKLGVRLFERLSHGYVMTTAGEHFLSEASQLRDGVHRIEREIGGQDLRLEGSLSVTTTDSLLYTLRPVFIAFQQQYTDVELKLISDSRSLDLMQRDADIALRPTLQPPVHWVGRQLFPIQCAVYAHELYWEQHGRPPNERHRWVRLDPELDRSPMSKLMMAQKSDDSPTTVVNTMMGVFDIVRAGLGIAAMPCYLGEVCSDLVRISEPREEYGSAVWVLSHPDVRRSARVHAFFEFVSRKTQQILPGLFQSEVTGGDQRT